jgi:hypothetical protein
MVLQTFTLKEEKGEYRSNSIETKMREIQRDRSGKTIA